MSFWGDPAGITRVAVWDSFGNLVALTNYDPSIDSYSTGFLATQATYYLTAYSDSIGYYGFRVVNDSVSEINPISQAIVEGQTYTAALDFASDVDSFVFTLSAGESIDISISSFGINFFLGVTNALLEGVDSAIINDDGTLRFVAPSTGIYTLGVVANDTRSTGSYTLSTNTLNQGPTLWSDVTYTGDLLAGEVLDATASFVDIDGNSDGIYRTGWYLDGAYITVAETFTLTTADYGKEVSIRFDLTDDAGNFEISDPYILGTVNTPVSGLPTVTGSVSQGSTLTADTSGLEDPDGLGSFSYVWLRDGTPISGSTGRTYELAANDVGAQIRVEVSYTDGGGNAESVTSGPTATVASNNEDLQGDSGDNTLSGGDGEDTLAGGPGSDTLEGGPDADRFVVKPGDEQIFIVDFELGLDILVH